MASAYPRRFARLENVVFHVTLDDALAVRHFGDSDPVLENFHPFLHVWQTAGAVAALFSPAWFLRGAKGQFIFWRIDARAVIGVQVQAAAQADPGSYRGALGGEAFASSGQRRSLSRGELP
ncbi:MAG: hypothetical protein AAGA68_24350 [Pseudomonadota bacterium]